MGFWAIFGQFYFYFCFGDLNLDLYLVNHCFVFLPDTLFLHILNEDNFRFDLINWITSFSLRPNWKSIASKGVLSSQAISIMRSVSAEFRNLGVIFLINSNLILLEIINYLCTYIPHFLFDFLKCSGLLICFGWIKWFILFSH